MRAAVGRELAFGSVVLSLAVAVVSATSFKTTLVFDRNGEIGHPTVVHSISGAVIATVLAAGVALGGAAAVRRALRRGRSRAPEELS